MTVVATVDRPASGPYRYLDYFQETDRLSFAGREDDISEVAARASSDEPFVLYGRSGLGKTSLLLAGVFPLLRDRRLHPVRLRVFEHPDVDLRNALAAELKREGEDTASDLPELVEQIARTEGLVLVFDQFEEFFISTRTRPAVRREFIHLLATLVHHPVWDVRLTISLREDYLAELDEFREEFPDILANQHRLLPLTAFGARQAIVAPLVLANIPFDQQLVVRLVDLLAAVDFDPVLLQIACGEVYREAIKRQGGGAGLRLTEQDLDRVGGIQGLFERYLDNAITRVPQGMLLLSRAVLDALITPEETKRAITFEALLGNDDFKASLEELEAVLDCLKQQKLVRGDLRTGHLWYELAHDRLAPSVVKWFKRDIDFAQFRDARDLIAEAARRAAYPAKLETLIGRLQIDKLINPYRERLRLTDEQRALMLWSAVYGQVENVDFWAALVGPERCEKAVLALLEHPAPEARLGAATAAARLAGGMPAVVTACVTRALDDPDVMVRRAAAVVLARHADPTAIEEIAAALKSRRQRRRALDVLATFVDAGGPIDRFGRWSRLRAHRHARRLTLAANRDAIIARGRRGVLVGFLGSAAWTATIGMLMACVATWAMGEIDWISTVLPMTSVAGAVAAVVGIACGWWLGRAGAKRAAIKGAEGRWGSVILRATGVLVVFAWLALGGVAVMEGAGLGFLTLGLVAAAAATGVVLPLYASLMRAVVWPPGSTGTAQRVFWAFLLGLPAAVPIALVSLVDPSSAGPLWITAGVVSALSTIVVLVLSETAVAFPVAPFPPIAPRARQIGRGLLLVSAAAGVAALWFTFGRDSLPFAPQAFDVSAGARIPIQLRSAVDSSYFDIRAGDGASPWFLVRTPEHLIVKGAATRLYPLSDPDTFQVVHIPAGRKYPMSATTPSGSSTDEVLEFEAIPQLKSDAMVELTRTRWTPFVLALEPRPADGGATRVWRAELPIVIQRGGPKPAAATLWIRPLVESVAFDTSAGGLKERLISYTPPAALAAFVVSAPPSKASAYYEGPEMQRIDIDEAGRAFVTMTFRADGKSSSDLQRISLPVGLTLVETFDWGRDWDNPAVLEDAANQFLLSKNGQGADDAIVLLKRVAELRPGEYEAQNNYAWALVTAGRGLEAVDAARRAVQLTSRKNAGVLDTLGHAEYAAGNWAEAVKAWDDMLAIDPEFYKPLRDPLCEKDQTLIEDARRKVRGAP